VTRPSLQALIERTVGAALIDKVPRDHHESDAAFRRRRVVVALALVVGAALLGVSLAARPGAGSFYLLTAAVALTWIAGGLLSGPLHLGYIPWRGHLRRPVITPILLGLGAAGVFCVGALIVREIPPLRDYVVSVLQHARRGNPGLIFLVTVLNGAAEEVFFRGALFAAIGTRHPVLISTGVYGLATTATRNPALVLASLPMGLLFGLQRRASGGIQAPMLTHATWSALMLRFLPPLFPDRPADAPPTARRG
jgi:membrane protease YdiL (CAAX protease family)